MKNGNGIRVYFNISSHNILAFIKGENVPVWPIKPSVTGGAEAMTQIRIDPDKIKITPGANDDVFMIQRKDIKPQTKSTKSRRAYMGYKDKDLGGKKRPPQETPLAAWETPFQGAQKEA